MTSLVVEVDVPEARLSQVAVDGPCEIVLDAYPTRRYRGAVKQIGRRIDRSEATVPVKIRFVVRRDDDGSSAGGLGETR
jgi:HlyD family secretion protein